MKHPSISGIDPNVRDVIVCLICFREKDQISRLRFLQLQMLHGFILFLRCPRQKGKEMEKENKMGQEKKVQIKVMIKKIKR